MFRLEVGEVESGKAGGLQQWVAVQAVRGQDATDIARGAKTEAAPVEQPTPKLSTLELRKQLHKGNALTQQMEADSEMASALGLEKQYNSQRIARRKFSCFYHPK